MSSKTWTLFSQASGNHKGFGGAKGFDLPQGLLLLYLNGLQRGKKPQGDRLLVKVISDA